jgi:hypothetical protein
VDESQMHVDIASFGTFRGVTDFQFGAELASSWADSIDWQGDFDLSCKSTLPFEWQ